MPAVLIGLDCHRISESLLKKNKGELGQLADDLMFSFKVFEEIFLPSCLVRFEVRFDFVITNILPHRST